MTAVPKSAAEILRVAKAIEEKVTLTEKDIEEYQTRCLNDLSSLLDVLADTNSSTAGDVLALNITLATALGVINSVWAEETAKLLVSACIINDISPEDMEKICNEMKEHINA